MSSDPIPNDSDDLSQSDFENKEYKAIGTQVGFDPKRLGKLWYALSNFLHVKVPTSKEDRQSIYGDPTILRWKLDEVLKELDRLSQGTLIMSGFGETVSFSCDCGATNKRRSKLLKDGQLVSCINPKCPETWTVSFENNDFFFSTNTISVDCRQCQKTYTFPRKTMLDLRLDKVAHFDCDCGEKNYVKWQLMQAKNPNDKVP